MTRNLKRKTKKLLYCLLVLCMLLLIQRLNQKLPKAPPALSNSYRVVKDIDGDTIEVEMEGKIETVRLIGIDTPETHDPRKPVQCFGQVASDFTRSQVENRWVRLATDSQSSNRDRYDRLLRYVYIGDMLLNAEIVRSGYGFVNTGFPFSKMQEFKSYQQQANSAKRGLWSSCQIHQLDNGQFQTNDN